MFHRPVQKDVKNGVIALEFDMPLPSVSLVLLSPMPASGPRRVSGLRGKVYSGLHARENVMLRWDCNAALTLRTYEVLWSSHRSGTYRRINRVDLICGAFVHARRSGVTGYYRVRAVDYWGRTGTVSAPVEV